MSTRVYDNFDLLIESIDATRYRARVTACPAGDAPAQIFTLPFSEPELADLLDRINPARPRVRRVLDQHEQACADLGGGLFDAVFRDEIRTAWGRSLDDTRDRRGGLRLRLRLGDAPTLAGLPWEFLYDRSGRRYFAQSDRTPIVRYLDVNEPPRPLLVDGPLRILVIISGPIGMPVLDTEAEWAKIADVLDERVRSGSVILDRLPTPTLGALQTWLRHNDVHVLHFVGHGEYDRRREEGYLAFCDSTRHVVEVTSAMLGAHVRDHDPLRLVVLNACQTATSDSVDVYGGVAQGLVQQEAAAVVAMQYPITDEAAIAFTGGFYGALTDGEPVDQAITSVRKTLLEGHPEEWATPVLFLRTADGRIFDHIEPHARAGTKQPRNNPEADAETKAEVSRPAGPHDRSPSHPRRRVWLSSAAAGIIVVAIVVAAIVSNGHGRRGSASGQTSTPLSTGAIGATSTNVGGVNAGTLKTTGRRASTFTGPSDSAYRQVATLNPHSTISARCTVYAGPGPKGDRLWYWTSDHRWINDYFVSTGGTAPVRPQCAGDVDLPSVGSGSPSQSLGPFTVVLGRTPSERIFDSPTTSGTRLGMVAADQLVTIACSEAGTHRVIASAGGTTSALWDQLKSGGWLPDAYLLTGVTTRSPAPACTGTASSPSVSSSSPSPSTVPLPSSS